MRPVDAHDSRIMNKLPIGICSWSIDRRDGVSAVQTAGALGLTQVHLGYFSLEDANRADPAEIAAAARDAGVTIVSTFAGFTDEDYSSIHALAESGGLLPDDRYAERASMIERVASISSALDVSSVAIHVGTVPEDSGAPEWSKLRERTAEVAASLARYGLTLLLETGRESAAVLDAFIEAVDQPNIAVNFDPANFIVFGTDEPARAVTRLRRRIANVHVKDAFRSDEPGVALGRRAAIGAGDVQVPRVLSRLRAVGYGGPLVIELGGGENAHRDITDAASYLRSMLESR